MYTLHNENYTTSKQMIEESLYMVGNGYLGVRGCFEEGYPSGPTVRGTYINGLYDQVPMVHAEMAYGFPTIQDKQPRLLDTQTCEVWLDGEKAQLIEGQYESYKREIDYKRGESVRRYVFITKSGKKAQLKFNRLASLVHINVMIYQIDVTYEGSIELVTLCDTNIENFSDVNDPRIGRGHTQLMECLSLSFDEAIISVLMQTKRTALKQATLIKHVVESPQNYAMEHVQTSGKIQTHIRGKNQIKLEKTCIFTDAVREPDTMNAALSLLEKHSHMAYVDFLEVQKAVLDAFWTTSGIQIEGASADQDAIRFMQYQLLQSVGIDAFSNVSAKGLSGEGYEGHYFWDTEIYVLPVLMLSQPEKAKVLLEYRHRILPYARLRAKELGHRKGAAFAWRTISGIECSGYFPAGTAQYHINADIAYAFIQYYLYTDDLTFLVHKGAEVIIETARIWLEIGHFYQERFHIHSVTGPDEYTAIVNNNYYTNAMAKYHLKWAHKIFTLLKGIEDPEIQRSVQTLFNEMALHEDELECMLKASNAMVLLYDETLGLYAQDDSFLSKPIWPFEEVDASKKPLLMHFHPLTIYRHQVLKQADTVLAHMLLEEYADESSIQNALEYYEALTTHDSSLSSCIYGIVASRCGLTDKAYSYFQESARLDLSDSHRNTKDGLHMANIAGTILSVVAGFAGLRITENSVQLRPQLPPNWTKLTFNLMIKGSMLKITMTDKTNIQLVSGAPLTVKVFEEEYLVTSDLKAYRGIVFDLDGVLTETSHAHFQAWRDLAHSIGFELPDTIENEVRGISRMESLEIVLKIGGVDTKYTADEKVELATQKNALYLKKIEEYSPADLSEGAFELLSHLKRGGYKIALASASNNAPFLLKAMGIDSFFDAVVSPSEIKKGKPAPDIFLRACEKINLDPSVCIGVEDAHAGIESIKAAGLLPIGIGNKSHLSNCTLLVGDIKMLLANFKRENELYPNQQHRNNAFEV